MRIISEGPEWQYEFTCWACPAELEADTTDLQMARDEGVPWYFVTCPVCSTFNRVPEEKLNAKIIKQVEQRKERENEA